MIAFSTAEGARRGPTEGLRSVGEVQNGDMSGLFQATVEATEEAVYNSILRATDVTGVGGRTVRALPIPETLEVLRRYNAIGGG